MTAANSLHRTFGRLSLPLRSTAVGGTLSQVDPAGTILLDLLAAAITAELEPIWDTAVAGTALSESVPVKQKFQAKPDAESLTQVKTAFPLLCVTRSSRPAQVEDLTLDQPQLTQLWDIDYLLGPLEIGTAIKLDPVLALVVKTVILVVNTGGHRAYLTGTNQGFSYAMNVLGKGDDRACGFHSATVTEVATGTGKLSDGGPVYYGASATLRTTEIAEWAESDGETVPFGGTTGSFGLTESGDPSITVYTPPPA